MKIAVVCANGKVGRLVVQEAANRGIDVTAVVRGENQSVAPHFISKDVLSITMEDLKGFDAVVDACGAWTAETLHIIPDAVKHLCEVLKGTDTRLLVVGGAGSLFVNSEHTKCVADGADFPEAFRPLAAVHAEALQYLRTISDVKWTYISPAADFQAEGSRTGTYTLSGEELTLNNKGESSVSYADYAIAMVDEITEGSHVQERISVVGK